MADLSASLFQGLHILTGAVQRLGSHLLQRLPPDQGVHLIDSFVSAYCEKLKSSLESQGSNLRQVYFDLMFLSELAADTSALQDSVSQLLEQVRVLVIEHDARSHARTLAGSRASLQRDRYQGRSISTAQAYAEHSAASPTRSQASSRQHSSTSSRPSSHCRVEASEQWNHGRKARSTVCSITCTAVVEMLYTHPSIFVDFFLSLLFCKQS